MPARQAAVYRVRAREDSCLGSCYHVHVHQVYHESSISSATPATASSLSVKPHEIISQESMAVKPDTSCRQTTSDAAAWSGRACCNSSPLCLHFSRPPLWALSYLCPPVYISHKLAGALVCDVPMGFFPKFLKNRNTALSAVIFQPHTRAAITPRRQ